MVKWSDILSPAALEKAKQLQARVKKEGANGHIIYPPQDQIFRALTLTPVSYTHLTLPTKLEV